MAIEGRSVLVATDLSARSDRAVDRAQFLAQSWGVRLKVTHVVEPGSWLAHNPDRVREAVKAILPDPAADVDIVVPDGPAPKAIVRVADQLNCGLIVTGVARFNHAGDFVVGTAVDHMVRTAHAPVLVVKQRPRGMYKTLLVATDFSSCSRHALLTAANMFPEAVILVVHADNSPFDVWLKSDDAAEFCTPRGQEDLDAFLDEPTIPQDVRDRIIPRSAVGIVSAVIDDLARESGADLVVIGTHGRSGFVRKVVGSMAESILFWVQPDTLMVREWPDSAE